MSEKEITYRCFQCENECRLKIKDLPTGGNIPLVCIIHGREVEWLRALKVREQRAIKELKPQ